LELNALARDAGVDNPPRSGGREDTDMTPEQYANEFVEQEQHKKSMPMFPSACMVWFKVALALAFVEGGKKLLAS